MTPVCYRVPLLLHLIMSVYCDNTTHQNPLESQVLLLLEKWRSGHVVSHRFQLPSLKSIKIPDVSYSYDSKGIKMTYELNKMKLTGLDSFAIEELVAINDKTSLEMSISLNVPQITLYAENYELKGRAYLLYPLKGSGNMTVIFRNCNLVLKIHFITIENGISSRIRDFRFYFYVHQIEANLLNSSWPINNILNSEGMEILNNHHDIIVQAMWDYIVPYVDDNLANITTTQIVHMLLNTNL